ncbi:MAG TPA: GspE/PulE family protein [Candidatus Paceibacterota bacterium]|nr:GspE/PulE family protein [Candidatus Paceibacterota bacterium]
MSLTQQYLNTESASEALDVPHLVHCILLDAINARASDVHIEPWEKTLAVRIRLDSVLTELVHLPRELGDKIASRFKVMANLISYQSDLPQEGHVPASPELGGVELRLSAFPTVRGEKIVVRLFDTRDRSFELDGLGLEEDTLANLINLLERPNGLILLTGPTGSGKTTAIYSALCHLVSKHGTTISLSTVEDPVEFHLPLVSQAQVSPAHEFTYPVALRSLMRQDPQVIMIGEIRDPETAAIAVQAGLTGHLVISTIHSGSTAGVFARLINMEIEPFLLASSVSGVLGLRLIRKNCSYCAEPYPPAPGQLKFVAPEIQEAAAWRRGGGCENCMQTGFSGRTAVAELMMVDEVLREAVMQKMPTRTLQQVAIQQGMRTLWQNGLRRAVQGLTPLDEILRVIPCDHLQ